MGIISFYLHIIPTKFGDCSLWESCDITFLIYHVITRSKLMPPNGYMQFHHYHQICFTCLFWNLWKLVMQSQAVIKKWDRNQLLQSYYKVWQKFITKCVRCHKVWQTFIQIVSCFTKCDSYYKVRRNTNYLLWKIICDIQGSSIWFETKTKMIKILKLLIYFRLM